MAGPIGWGFVVLGITDSFLYDENAVDKLFSDGITGMQRGQMFMKDGDIIKGVGAQLLAADQLRLANQINAYHAITEIPALFGNTLSWAWNRTRGKEDMPEAKKTPLEAPNRSGFFQPAQESVTKKKEGVINDSSTYQVDSIRP